MSKPEVGIIMGSDSDLKIMKEAALVLEELQVQYELTVVSAHRTPLRMVEYAQSARAGALKLLLPEPAVLPICPVWWHPSLHCL